MESWLIAIAIAVCGFMLGRSSVPSIKRRQEIAWRMGLEDGFEYAQKLRHDSIQTLRECGCEYCEREEASRNV